VSAAEGFLVAAGLLAAVTGPRTVDWTTFADPQPLVLAAVAAGFLYLAIRRQSTWRAALGAVMVAAGARYAAPDLASEATLEFWQWHGPLLAVLAVTAVFNDDLAKGLRELSWRAVPVLAALGSVVYPWTMPGIGPLTLTTYLAVLLLVSIGLWQRTRLAGPLGASLTTAAANGVVHLHALYRLLGETALADGRPWLAAGLVLVALALLISLAKMGLWRGARQWLERLNLTLAGSKSQPL
jgi:hypothetical protein